MFTSPPCLAATGADLSVLQRQHLHQSDSFHFPTMPLFQATFSGFPVLGSHGDANDLSSTSSLDVDHSLVSTTSAPVLKEELLLPADEMLHCANGGTGFKKRKPEYEESRDKKRNRGDVEEDDQTPHEDSKIPDARNQKPDYVHVRARRGQATDSHSLAERARREKINKKMKSLQELVPGCNKPTGKAGMLDEIINYVQSLQRQVEFLSMKLAHVNPRLELSIDNIFTKEFPARVASTLSEMADLAYNQPNSVQPAANCEMDTLMLLNPLQTAEQRVSSSPQVQSFSPWETDLLNLYNGGF